MLCYRTWSLKADQRTSSINTTGNTCRVSGPTADSQTQNLWVNKTLQAIHGAMAVRGTLAEVLGIQR